MESLKQVLLWEMTPLSPLYFRLLPPYTHAHSLSINKYIKYKNSVPIVLRDYRLN